MVKVWASRVSGCTAHEFRMVDFVLQYGPEIGFTWVTAPPLRSSTLRTGSVGRVAAYLVLIMTSASEAGIKGILW